MHLLSVLKYIIKLWDDILSSPHLQLWDYTLSSPSFHPFLDLGGQLLISVFVQWTIVEHCNSDRVGNFLWIGEAIFISEDTSGRGNTKSFFD